MKNLTITTITNQDKTACDGNKLTCDKFSFRFVPYRFVFGA